MTCSNKAETPSTTPVTAQAIETRWIAQSDRDALALAASWFRRHTLSIYQSRDLQSRDLQSRDLQGQGFVNWALSGGKTPKSLYSALAAMDDLPWSSIRLFLVDERDEETSSDHSNLGMLLQTGLEKRLAPHQIFGMRKGPFASLKLSNQASSSSHHDADIDYEKLINELCPSGSLDLVLLGMGSDGHTASLFPGTKAGSELDPSQLVVTHPIPSLSGAYRRSLSFESLLRARHLLFYLLGQDKAPSLDRVWNDPLSTLPCALLRRWRLERHQPVDWVVDTLAVGVATQ